jgi:hypothetical protein
MVRLEHHRYQAGRNILYCEVLLAPGNRCCQPPKSTKSETVMRQGALEPRPDGRSRGYRGRIISNSGEIKAQLYAGF